MVAFPDESMGEALARMGIRGVGRMPVVSRDDQGQLIGLIRRADIIRAYNLALARKTDVQPPVEKGEKKSLSGGEFIKFLMIDGDKVIGEKVEDVAPCMPEESILISIKRNGNVIIPHGDTRFQTGDLITAFVREKDIETLQACLKGDHPIKNNSGNKNT